MRGISVIILLNVVIRTHTNLLTNAHDFRGKFADKLVHRLFESAVQLPHREELDNTTFGIPDHLVLPPRAVPMIPVPVPVAFGRYPHRPQLTSGNSRSTLGHRMQVRSAPLSGSATHVSTVSPPETDEITSTGAAMPTNFDSQFMQTMLDRGFIHQCTDFKALDEKFAKTTVIAYLGFDATASSLHVGSLLQIMILRTLQKFGHKPIILIGGGTTKVGDPSGKDESRQLLTEEVIQSNAENISQIFKKFIRFGDGPSDAIMVNNADWLDGLKYLEFLRDYGRHFTINRMLNFESVKQRLSREQPLTVLEFNYMLLQAYDFLELHRRQGAILQLGGSDQWGNIISGVELGRRAEQAELFGLTAPLITTSDGKKMGKTASGAMWLNKDLLSEFEYWQFWRNTADADVIRFLKLFTELPLEEINTMAEWTGADLNKAKKILADEATRMLHGADCLPTIHATVQSLFGGGAGKDLDSLPQVKLTSEDISVVDALILAELCKSKGEARRQIKAGAIRVNDEKVNDEWAPLDVSAYDEQGRIKLSSGKKKHAVLLRP